MQGNQGQGGNGNAQHGAGSPTLGIGHRTSGEAGSTPTHETMAETGGSGGGGLTGYDASAPDRPDSEGRPKQSAGEEHISAGGHVQRRGTDEMADSGARGYQDTRSEQAGGTGTGLGTPETGSNQNEQDLEGSARHT